MKKRAYGPRGDAAAASAPRATLGAHAVGAALPLQRRTCRSSPKRCGRGGRRDRCTAPSWPTVGELGVPGCGHECLRRRRAGAREIRKAKSTEQRSMRTEVVRATVFAPPRTSRRPLELALDDVREAGRVVGAVDARPRRRAAGRGRRSPRPT